MEPVAEGKWQRLDVMEERAGTTEHTEWKRYWGGHILKLLFYADAGKRTHAFSGVGINTRKQHCIIEYRTGPFI